MILGEEFVGAQIAQWRTNLGMSIAEAAKLGNVPASVWGRIESGKTPNPYMDTVIKMVRALGAQIEVKMAPRPAAPQQLPLDIPTPKKLDRRLHADA